MPSTSLRIVALLIALLASLVSPGHTQPPLEPVDGNILQNGDFPLKGGTPAPWSSPYGAPELSTANRVGPDLASGSLGVPLEVRSECVPIPAEPGGYSLEAWFSGFPQDEEAGALLQLRFFQDANCSSLLSLQGTSNVLPTTEPYVWFRKAFDVTSPEGALAMQVRAVMSNMFFPSLDGVALVPHRLFSNGFESGDELWYGLLFEHCTTNADCTQPTGGCGTNACVEGICRPALNPGFCSDGNGCTERDVCVDGWRCEGTFLCRNLDLDAGPCEKAVCFEISPTEGSCSLDLLNNIPCNDGNECTLGEECVVGECQPVITLPDCTPSFEVAVRSGRPWCGMAPGG